MQNIHLGAVVLGLFILVWVISSVMKASQSAPQPPARRPMPPRRNDDDRDDQNREEEQKANPINQFLEEIDRMRQNRQQGGPPPVPKPNRPRPEQREQRPQQERPRPKPPQTTEKKAVPVLVPVNKPTHASSPEFSGSHITQAERLSAPIKIAKVQRATRRKKRVSNAMKLVQHVLRHKDGKAAALILREIFDEPKAKRKPKA